MYCSSVHMPGQSQEISLFGADTHALITRLPVCLLAFQQQPFVIVFD